MQLEQSVSGVQPEAMGAAAMELDTFLKGSIPKIRKSLKYCIVTNELVEFHQNGGLGTATSGLIHALAAKGVDIDVLYTARLDLKTESVRAGIAKLGKRGINFIALQEAMPSEWMDTARKISYACYWVLRKAAYDVIHFNDYLGNAYYTAQARRTGTALKNSTIFVTVHGPTRWAMGIDERPIANLDLQEVSFLEFRALEFADVVLGVSQHLIGWLKEHEVKLPKHTYVHKNILPDSPAATNSEPLKPKQLTNVAFFARQDVRKGFLIMLDAIRTVAKALPHVRFTFVGKFSRIAGEHSGAMALDVLSDVPNIVEFRHEYDRDKALNFLRTRGTLAVIPSLDENSPCTVIECITAGVPFIASSVGGIPELVANEFQEKHLFKPNAASLASAIIDVANSGCELATLKFDPKKIEGQLIGGLDALHSAVQTEYEKAHASLTARKPLVSVVITHFNRHLMLHALLQTLEQQTYSNFEVVIVDDGSTADEAVAFIESLSSKKFAYAHSVVRIKNSYLGAARNAGVNAAKGEFVKFQDDDNLPFPIEIEKFVEAALFSDAHIVTGMSRFFRNEKEVLEEVSPKNLEYVPLGASLPLSIFHNTYGDANSLVSRKEFLEDGGFTEIYGVGSEDYEFFVKSESIGRRIMFVPEPIFNYRVSAGSMLRSTSIYKGAMRSVASLKFGETSWMKSLLGFAHEAELDRTIKRQAWWSAGGRKFPEIHQQLLEGDPNEQNAVEKFFDLAIRYERIEDILYSVIAKTNSLAASRRWLDENAQKMQESYIQGRQFQKDRPQLIRFNSFAGIQLIEPLFNLPTDWSVFQVAPDGLLVHPLKGRVVQVLVPQALPVGTSRIAVPFSHRSQQGNLTRVAIAVMRGGEQIAASGWKDLPPGSATEIVITLKHCLSQKADIVLMSSVEGSQDYAWVFADHLCLEFVEIK